MGALHFRKHEMKIANNVKQAEALNTLLLIGIFLNQRRRDCTKSMHAVSDPSAPLGRYFPFCSYVELCLRPLKYMMEISA